MNRPLGDAKSGTKGYQNTARVNNSLSAFVLLLLSLATSGEASEAVEPLALADLAGRADVVALVQVLSTDYAYRRGFPHRGSALLEILIPYKGVSGSDVLEVHEEGLRPFECYFPQPAGLAEGRRYLVFLASDPDKPERLRGLPQGCALDVLVTADNRYALRVPVDGVKLSSDLRAYARELKFADRYALETEESIKPERRDALLLAGDLEQVGERYRYTRGISLESFRPLLELELR